MAGRHGEVGSNKVRLVMYAQDQKHAPQTVEPSVNPERALLLRVDGDRPHHEVTYDGCRYCTSNASPRRQVTAATTSRWTQ